MRLLSKLRRISWKKTGYDSDISKQTIIIENDDLVDKTINLTKWPPYRKLKVGNEMYACDRWLGGILNRD